MDFLSQYKSPLSNKNFLRCSASDERFGVLHHSPIDFDITQIFELTSDEQRYQEITAMVIDYHMPDIDGFSLAKSCDDLPVHKILLTGTAEDQKIISGFNHNVIQRFVQKGDADMEEKLKINLQELSLGYFQNKTAHLLAHLEAENSMPLSDCVFVEFFKDFCKRKNIREYYLMDKQGSFLCINADGKRFFLVLHNDRSLDDWISIYGDELPKNNAREITERKKIPFFGLGKEAWNIPSEEWSNYFFEAQCLLGRERYFWFEMDESTDE